MPSLVPDNAHLNCRVVVSNLQIDRANLSKVDVFRYHTDNVCRAMMEMILERHVKVRPLLSEGQTVFSAECYVLSPKELAEIVAKARKQGEEDAIRYYCPKYEK